MQILPSFNCFFFFFFFFFFPEKENTFIQGTATLSKKRIHVSLLNHSVPPSSKLSSMETALCEVKNTELSLPELPGVNSWVTER